VWLVVSTRSRRCTGGVVALGAAGVLVGALVACGRRPAPQITSGQFELIQRQLAAQDAARVATQPPAPASSPGMQGASGDEPPPPRDDAERRKRALSAVAPGIALGEVVPVADGTRYVLSLARVESDGARAPHLVLIDVSGESGFVVGEHEFDLGRERTGTAAPVKISRAVSLGGDGGEPVVLAELLGGGEGDASLFGFCGWSLGRRPEFQCAPRLGSSSRYEVRDGELVESWTVDSAGVRTEAKAGTRSGRVLRFADGRWAETDGFRCLGRPLAEAFAEAGRQSISAWQRETVRRLTQAAKRESDALETDVAIARLQGALEVDGCAPEVWRVLGRLEFEAGRPKAAATLAVAMVLAPRDDAVVLDLADALAVLDTRRPEQRESWHTAVAVLDARATTRGFVQGAGGKSPAALALALYRAFLERTPADDDRLRARRRRVEQKVETLRATATGR
jgi:hypothetical protein